MTSHWSEEATKALISMWREEEVYAAVASSTSRNKVVYDTLAARLASLGFERTPVQIKNKLKTLKRDYKTATDNNRRSGRGRISCRYFDMMDEVLGCRAGVNPRGILDLGDGAGASCSTSGDLSSEEEDDLIEGPSTSSTSLETTGSTAGDEDDNDIEPADIRPVIENDEVPNEEEILGEQQDVQQAPGNGEQQQALIPKRKRESRGSTRERSVKEAIDRVLLVNKERDRVHREEQRKARAEDAELAKQEAESIKEMLAHEREQLQFQREDRDSRERMWREERERRDRREREERERQDRRDREERERRRVREQEEREREDRRWSMLFSVMSQRMGPAQGVRPEQTEEWEPTPPVERYTYHSL